MSQSTNIVIRDLTTGAGRTGLTVTLKNHLDNFTAVVATGAEISGKPGVYQFIDLPLAKYKEYINGTEDTSYGGTHGRWLPVMDNLPVIDGTNAWSGTNGYSTEKTLSDAKEFTYKKWVETAITALASAINSAINALTITVGLKADASAVETDYFKKTGGNTTQNILNPVRFSHAVPPVCNAAPTVGNQLINKSFHDTDIEVRLSNIISGNYQESLNIVRVMPNGADQIGTAYNTIGKAIAYCNSLSPISTKKFTLLITGEGTSAEAIDYSSYSYPMTQYMRDYVHFKGLGADVRINLNKSILENEFKSFALGRVIIEDLYFYTDDGGDTGEQIFENIIFKNCKFYTKEAVTASFINCKFEGSNQFASFQDNAYTFTNCTGSPITSDSHPVTVAGTNKISFFSPALSSIASPLAVDTSLQLNNFVSTHPEPVPVSTIVKCIGNVENGTILAEPEKWVNISIDGTIYALPLYAL